MNRTAVKPITLPGTRGVRLLRHSKPPREIGKRDRRSNALNEKTEKPSDQASR
jgi:hypothetical protein